MKKLSQTDLQGLLKKEASNLNVFKKKTTDFLNLKELKANNIALFNEIVDQIGDLDSATYTEDYMADNIYCGIQNVNGELDFYLVTNEVFNDKYNLLSDTTSSFIPENIKAYTKLYSQGDAEVEMLYMTEPLTIEAPWGGEQVSKGDSCYLVKGDGEVYMVQEDEDGLPINYVRV